MARLILVMALFLLAGWLFFNFSDNIDEIAGDVSGDKAIMEMIEKLEAPAAGGNN